MASSTPRQPEPFRPAILSARDFHVDEIAAEQAGSLSPFGPELEFPLPIERIRYTHPGPADRPNLAEGR